MRVNFVQYDHAYLKIKDEIDRAMQRVLESGDLILRKEVEVFEQNLSTLVGTKHAIAVANGTDALMLSLRAAGVGQGDEVVTVGHTFHATVEAIVHVGAKPVLVDVNELGVMDVDKVNDAITPNTAAIIPVHLMGDMVDMKALQGIVDVNNLARNDFQKKIVIIEDACQALGALWEDKKAGAWGLAAAFSFYPAKILGAAGDAGAITTNDDALAVELREMRNHYKGKPGKYGFNSRMDNLQAAILNVRFRYLRESLEKRRLCAVMYNDNLFQLPIVLPKYRDGRVWQDYVIRTKHRDALYDFLKEQGVETMKNDYHFPDDLPKPLATIELEQETLRLPCNAEISPVKQHEVIFQIKKFYEAM